MIYGLHDEHPKGLMKSGWVLLTKEVGHDPGNHDGEDFSEWRREGIEPIVRLNNGYGSAGTIPLLQYYGDFATRCANYVQASQGCDKWIIGNEPNHSQERPDGVPITASSYVNCFRATRGRIKSVSPLAQVMTAPVAVWNVETGDWLEYFDVLMQEEQDGIALHTYTHGSDPSLITSEAMMDPFQDRRYHFRAYRDFLNRLPDDKRSLPVYITETDQDVPWLNENKGWVRNAYKEIDQWNKSSWRPKIHCLCLYRWPKYDQWYIDGKSNVILDFYGAQEFGYEVPSETIPVEPPIEPPNGGGEMIVHDGFEDGFYNQDGIGPIRIPNEWAASWWNGDYDTPHGIQFFRRPEYASKYQTREVYAGDWAANVFSASSVHNACLFRGFNIGSGRLVTAEVMSMIVGQKGSGHEMRIGIDLTAGLDCWASTVTWGGWYSTFMDEFEDRAWIRQFVTTRSTGDWVTVFLHSRNINYNVWSHAHWDEFVLTVEGDEPEPPIPPDPPDTDDPFDWERLARAAEVSGAVFAAICRGQI
jgi:hypothetical protein